MPLQPGTTFGSYSLTEAKVLASLNPPNIGDIHG